MNKLLIGCLLVLSFSALAERTASTDNFDPIFNSSGQNVGNSNGTSAKNVGSLTGAPVEHTVMVAGVPVEKIAVSVIDPDAIRKLLREQIPQFRYCYQKELDMNNNPEAIQGKITLKFMIVSAGKVEKAEVVSDEITLDKVRECIKNVLEGVQFPDPRGGRSVEVSQPINLFPKRI